MSQDFSKVLVKDPRLCVTEKLQYGIEKGGQSMTPYVYNAISSSPSSITFNIQVPSEQTVIDRRVIWNAQVTLKFVFTAGQVPVGQVPIQYGLTDALAPFPLHQLTTVQSVTVNNNTVSMNTRDVINALMRSNDKRALMRYNGMCPNMFDTYGNYADGVGSVNNSLGSYSNVGDNDLLPRGAFLVDEIYTLNGTNHAPQPISDGASSYTVYVRFTTSEPLLLSPFMWANPSYNDQGFYGIQNMNAVFNLGDCSRVWRSASSWVNTATGPTGAAAPCAITVDSIGSCRLIFNQLTPHPSDLLPSRNVVPYYTVPRYITQFNSSSNSIAAAYSFTNGVYTVPTQMSGTTISSTNIQLNQIPKLFFNTFIGDENRCVSVC